MSFNASAFEVVWTWYCIFVGKVFCDMKIVCVISCVSTSLQGLWLRSWIFFFFWKYCLVDLDLCLLGFIWKSHINKFCSFFLWITFEGVHLRESHVKVTAKVELSPWLVLIQSPALPACYTSKVWCLLFSQIKACKARALWCELDVLLVCLCLELTSNLVVNASLLFFNLNL
jgi:hypothetical protein